MKNILSLNLLLLALITSFTIDAQKKEDVLFTYGGNAVTKKEFLRMYTKNINNQQPDFSEKAVREYLTLYSRFKMKVAEANALKIDTLANIESELSTYKKQLAKTYLTDAEMKNKLLKEAYERSKKDVRVAHILISTPRNNDDTLSAYQKIDSLYNAITVNNADFSVIARMFSDDKQSGLNGGDLGFITTLQIVYPFENVAYNTPVDDVSKPFKTIYGYHIIKKLEERPARGEIQVAQILVNVKKSAGEAGDKIGKARIDSVYTLLKNGASFEAMVEKYSDDKFSLNSKGVLPTFGVGQMLPVFEDAAFSLKKAGDISQPVKTEYGYHIIKLISKTPLKPFDSVKTDLGKRIEKDSRTDIARLEYTEKVKDKLNFKEYPIALNEIIAAISDSTLMNGTYNANTYAKYKKPLFTMTNVEFTQADFANYLEAFTKAKMYGKKEATLRSLYKNYADKAMNDFQENRLVDDNEDYRNLLTEYRDGIMLFELTDKSVWSRASMDTTGLNEFYTNNKSNYQWGSSIKGTIYKANDEATAILLEQQLNNPKNKTSDDVLKAVSEAGAQNKLVAENGKYEKSRFPVTLNMIAGKYCPYYKNEEGTYTILKVDEVDDEPSQKTLSEARGYVISEYQEYLEKKWIADLEAKYPVKLNEKVIKSIIK